VFTVKVHRDGEKALRRLPRDVQQQVAVVIRDLKDNPYCHNAEKLTARGSAYRIRVGSYRVIYDLDLDEHTILITKIAPRGEHTYRR